MMTPEDRERCDKFLRELRDLTRDAAHDAMHEYFSPLYDVARKVCHEFGYDWTDPRTGITHKAPR